MKRIKKSTLLLLLAAGLSADVCAARGDKENPERGKDNKDPNPHAISALPSVFRKLCSKEGVGSHILKSLNAKEWLCFLRVTKGLGIANKNNYFYFNVEKDIPLDLTTYTSTEAQEAIIQAISTRNKKSTTENNKNNHTLDSIRIIPERPLNVETMVELSKKFKDKCEELGPLSVTPKLVFVLDEKGAERLKKQYDALRARHQLSQMTSHNCLPAIINLKLVIKSVHVKDLAKYPFMKNATGVETIYYTKINPNIEILLENNKNTISCVILSDSLNNDSDSFGALTKLQNLKHWISQDKDIFGDNVKKLALTLPHLPNLETLNLHANWMGKDGVLALASVLSKMTNLTTLDLGCNRLGKNGAIELAKVLPHLTNLTTFDLAYNNLGEDGKNMLRQLVKGTKNHLFLE